MKNDFKDRKIMYGKGKEYSDVSHETTQTFRNWLAFSGMTEEEFDRRMKRGPYRIEERVNEDGDIEINLYAGFVKVIEPLILPASDGTSVDQLDDFLVDAVFLLTYIASRYEDKSFEKAVKEFMERMIEERKMTL